MATVARMQAPSARRRGGAAAVLTDTAALRGEMGIAGSGAGTVPPHQSRGLRRSPGRLRTVAVDVRFRGGSRSVTWSSSRRAWRPRWREEHRPPPGQALPQPSQPGSTSCSPCCAGLARLEASACWKSVSARVPAGLRGSASRSARRLQRGLAPGQRFRQQPARSSAPFWRTLLALSDSVARSGRGRGELEALRGLASRRSCLARASLAFLKWSCSIALRTSRSPRCAGSWPGCTACAS